jgi:hypothetical protein
MGVVYEAEPEYSRRVVALEVIRPGWSNPELVSGSSRSSRC